MFGVSPIVFMAVMLGFVYGRFIIPSPRTKALRAKYRKQLRERMAPPKREVQVTFICEVCEGRATRSALPPGILNEKDYWRYLQRIGTPQPPVPERLKLTPEKLDRMCRGEPEPQASTGCELTDQIFEAARKMLQGVFATSLIP
jgi:hypothetical protein